MSAFAKLSHIVSHKAVLCLAFVCVVLLGYGAVLPANAEIVDESAITTAEVAEQPASESVAEAEQVTQPNVGAKPKTVANIAQADTRTQTNYGPYLTIAGKVSAPIVGVGLDSNGAIAVPGSAIGRYQIMPDAPIFLDGHSSGVFSRLNSVGVGEIVSITASDGSVSNYQVYNVKIYDYDPSLGSTDAAGNLTINGWFMRESLYDGGADGLNMMTCAGTYLPAYGTYDQRLVVFAKKI
jgi:sortase (surface protein transpeptidase)